MKKFILILLAFLCLTENAFAQSNARQIQSSDVTGALGYTPLRSIGGMTGPAILCGSGMSCAGNTISAITFSPGGVSGQIQYNNLGSLGGFTVGGDATVDTSSGNLTLATVNANVGVFGSSTSCVSFTTNGKGLITAASATTCTPNLASITGLGTGVASALAVNVGTANSFVVNGGALGTPSSGTLTNVTGLVPTTGLAATGTPSASTYLRGDNSWATVSGSGTVTQVDTGGLATGGPITTTGTVTVTAATKSNQQTGTSTTTVVTPAQQQSHDSAAKAWVNFTGSTGAINASYGVTSVNRTGAGNYTITLSTAFASAVNYVATGTVEDNAANTYLKFGSGANKTTTTIAVFVLAAGGGSTVDPGFVNVVFYGRQ